MEVALRRFVALKSGRAYGTRQDISDAWDAVATTLEPTDLFRPLPSGELPYDVLMRVFDPMHEVTDARLTWLRGLEQLALTETPRAFARAIRNGVHSPPTEALLTVYRALPTHASLYAIRTAAMNEPLESVRAQAPAVVDECLRLLNAARARLFYTDISTGQVSARELEYALQHGLDPLARVEDGGPTLVAHCEARMRRGGREEVREAWEVLQAALHAPRMAFGMGLHSRLNAESPLRGLNADMIYAIVRQL
jgi:hypothetical protein